ncbi:A/G-specific adenine glycosylase [Salinarimonas ramus]|uniref:Adenine DNA glycosylase n=1 Tax=Salinarimonas ramus TaxID=690164 RepID=A0A917V5F7_9HYPH|nr:A/G-specific adenine glycosylase [Salinarimonas ramus]GGK39323.1 A/G-specific adenine glycosylase [Salinarimonas ramus]
MPATQTRAEPSLEEPRNAEPAGGKPISAADLLTWYDRHRRALPWRARPGEAADPYRVWLSEIMLQQTTVMAVKPYFERFLTRFPTVEALAAAPSEEVMNAWAGLGYYSRARNLHACAKAVVAEHGGRFPDTEDGLRALPGIGAYTAGAIAAIAFDRVAAAVDGNVERVMTRLHAIAEPMPKAKAAVREATLALVPPDRPGDFAQALMDLGATICTPKRPACALCPWMSLCAARRAGEAELYPVKAPKKTRETRRGAAFVVERADGAILLRTRAPEGLLGGMAEPPGSAWSVDWVPSQAILDAPLDARWKRLDGVVRHVFTHFTLEASVLHARVAAGTAAPDGMRFTPREAISQEPLPSVMKKILAHALGEALFAPTPAGAGRGRASKEPGDGEAPAPVRKRRGRAA